MVHPQKLFCMVAICGNLYLTPIFRFVSDPYFPWQFVYDPYFSYLNRIFLFKLLPLDAQLHELFSTYFD